MTQAPAEIWFYQLLHTPLERALPQLLLKTRERGWKAMVEAPDAERLRMLDDGLWTFSEESFLAHGRASDPDAAFHPVCLAQGSENPNRADARFYVAGAWIDPQNFASGDQYSRAVLMFDGRDGEMLERARTQWKELRGLGLAMTYFEQREDGGWSKKFEQPAASA
ncbi:MAG: DNA polymerase III subunit chi [Alphaproteobacteria bacterium]|nr:DNA polymerase III subunit chi [Alphaproteobacteria bacterium]